MAGRSQVAGSRMIQLAMGTHLIPTIKGARLVSRDREVSTSLDLQDF